jgi:outer membrane receptor protein involved in Fe transport
MVKVVMKKPSPILLGALGAGSLILLDATPATGATLEEVVVTARKREESLQDVPVSIQALDNAKIERYDATTLDEIADMANNVQITAGTNGSGGSFIIRGYGSPATDSGIESSVALNIDGVQTARGFVSRTAFFDLESVQILKGPQALFFGKDSPAGVVESPRRRPPSSSRRRCSGATRREPTSTSWKEWYPGRSPTD